MKRFIDLINEMNDHTPPQFERDDQEFYDARDRTGFFGEQAAGCLVLAKATGRLLIVHRSADVDQPFTWGNLGGAHKASEQPQAAAQRELYEETGYNGSVEMLPLYVFRKGDFCYRNFLAVVPEEFEPQLGWEADDYVWVEFGNWPSPLHFGLQALFADRSSVQTIQKLI